MKDFEQIPSSTAVMELLAKYKKTTVKDLVLDFLNFENLESIKKHAKMEKFENFDIKALVGDYDIAFFEAQNKPVINFPHNVYIIYPISSRDVANTLGFSLKVIVDDFNISIIHVDREGLSYKNCVQLSEKWRKQLFDFDKDFMFSEFANLCQHKHLAELKQFSDDYKKLKTAEMVK